MMTLDDHDLVHDKVKFDHLCVYMGKTVKNVINTANDESKSFMYMYMKFLTSQDCLPLPWGCK